MSDDDILRTSFDLLDQTADIKISDPHRADLMEHWNSLRKKPEPPKPQVRSTADQRQERWTSWFEQQFSASLFKSLTEGFLKGCLGQVLSEERQDRRRELAAEVAELRRDLDAAREKIEKLQRSKGSEITSWLIDCKKYTVTPLMGGKPGPTLNLRELFEAYHHETNS
jgi:hypothetical protein